MTPSRLFALCLAVVAVGACSDDDELGAPAPVAGVRFVNAVGDTGSMDFRVVDIVGDAPQFLVNAFRAFTPYQAVTAGTRRLRVFMTPSQADTLVGAPLMWDTTFTFVAGTNYTVLMTGFARAGGGVPLQMLVTDDPASDPGAGQMGLRVINAGAGVGAVDAFTRRTGAAPGAPLLTGLAFGAAGTYTGFVADTPTMRVAVTGPGGAPTLADVLGPPGVAGTPAANPIAGTNIPGSVLTAIFLPAAVAGSQAPAGAATVIYIADRRPPMTVP